MRGYLSAVRAIFWKDLLAERRTREILGAMLVFALIIILIFIFAFDLSVETRRTAAPGVIWVTLCFSGTISLNRTMSLEKEREGMDALLLAPVDRTAIFTGKALVNWVYMLVTALVILPVYSIFNNVNLLTPGILGVVLLGSLGYTLTGTLLAALSIQLKTRDLLLPILLFPVLIPLLLAAVRATSLLLLGGAIGELGTWLLLLAGFDLLFLAVSVLVFDKIMEE